MGNINKDTFICISIASRPGNFGAKFHNRGYELLGLDGIYLPRKVEDAEELKNVIQSVRTLGIRGCSVSMPHKEAVLSYVDEIDPFAKAIGSINTILNYNGILVGYNTDYFGAYKALATYDIKGKPVVMLGAGGAAKAVGLAVKELGGRLTIANRTPAKAKNLGVQLSSDVIFWDELKSVKGCILINATSVGMNDPQYLVIDKDIISRFELVMDVVIYPAQTQLLKTAKELGIDTVPGTVMCVYQASEQFKIYTGKEAPQELIEATLREF